MPVNNDKIVHIIDNFIDFHTVVFSCFHNLQVFGQIIIAENITTKMTWLMIKHEF